MKRYDSYKDSGVEWMDEIPSKWEKSRIRLIGNLYGGLTGKKGSDFNDEDNPSNKPFVPFTNIFNNTYISKNHFQYVNVEYGENQNRVLKNDLFFLMSSESYEDLGKCSILLEDVEELYLNSFCKGYRVKDSRVYPLFLNYQLLGSLHKEMISIEGNGFTRINLRQDRLLYIPVFIPPTPEQQQIVSFLDTKTSLIDSLIEKTQRKIELLKEKRTSLINEVVTKGLNPKVEMKDSGVEWIGDIPSHWELKKIKHLKSSEKYSLVDGPFGSNLKSIHYVDDGDVYVIESGFITSGKFKYVRKFKTITEEHFETIKRSQCKEGDIIISKIGEYYGMSGILPKLDKKSVISGNSLSLTLNEDTNTEFIHQVLIQHRINGTFKKEVQQTGQPFISLGVINNLVIPTPDLNEQQQIVEYLDEQTQLIDNTISIEEKRIELLKEYRQSLISEVVTGKIKVTTDE